MKKSEGEPGNWLVCIRRCERPRLRLICFPYGGAGAASFWNWQSDLARDIELWAVRLPGRENRFAEHFVTDADHAVRSIADNVRRLRDVRLVFYGHSLGAGLACQTANLLRSEGETLPVLFIASGRLPPHEPYPAGRAQQPEEELVAHLAELGGVPLYLLNNKAFLSIYLPKIRADFQLNETLSYVRYPAFDFPITVINGVDDPLVNEGLLRGWRDYTTREFRAFGVAGGHFFIQSHFGEFMSILSGQLAELCAAAGA